MAYTSNIANIPTVELNPQMSNSIFDTVFNYLNNSRATIDIKRVVCHRLQSEIADENLANMKRSLSEFSKLDHGWDGYGDALPISTMAINHTKQVLGACRSSDLLEWRLFPNTNGSILLELDNAAVSIGDDSFTYWYESDGKDFGEEYVPFSVKGVLNVIKKINSYV